MPNPNPIPNPNPNLNPSYAGPSLWRTFAMAALRYGGPVPFGGPLPLIIQFLGSGIKQHDKNQSVKYVICRFNVTFQQNVVNLC